MCLEYLGFFLTCVCVFKLNLIFKLEEVFCSISVHAMYLPFQLSENKQRELYFVWLIELMSIKIQGWSSKTCRISKIWPFIQRFSYNQSILFIIHIVWSYRHSTDLPIESQKFEWWNTNWRQHLIPFISSFHQYHCDPKGQLVDFYWWNQQNHSM